MDLQIRDLSTRHADGSPAPGGVSLVLPVGVCGLLGAGGAGKSTLLRVLAGLDVAGHGGAARLDGIDLLDGSDAAHCAVGYLPQDLTTTCKAGADEVLNHHAVVKGLQGYQARRDIVEALLQQVGLWDVRRQPPGQFSVAMRQRFGIAIALLGRPPLVLLDAPAAGLDGADRGGVLDLVASLGRHHVVLMATRDVADVAVACARMLVLDGGQVRMLSELQPRRGGEAAAPAAAA